MATVTTELTTTKGKEAQRWEPLDIFEEFETDMARFWQQPWLPMPRMLARFPRFQDRLATVWRPTVDVFEKNGHLVVKAELPGVKKEDVSVTLDKGDLVISGERKVESEVKEGHVYRMERSYGSFYRRLPLPEEVLPEQIEASFKDGVLEVRLPKPKGQAKAQKIALK
jgi:HSP20 family protein